MSQPAQPRWGFTSLFDHVPHPHVEARKEAGPVKVADQHKRSNWYSRVNARIAIWVTVGVGSMTCAWLFAALAIAGLPTALKPGNIGFLFWFSSDLLQLTLLSVIIVGQNIQAQAADKRAEQTYLDAEAVLHEAQQIQAHLAAQDAALTGLAGQLQDLVTAQAALLPGAAAAERVVPSRARKANGGGDAVTQFFDSARWGLIPAGSMACVYYDGKFAITPQDARRFSAVRWITVYGGAAVAAHTGVIDWESGNPSFEGNALAEWAEARREMNCRARVYCDLENLPRAHALAGSMPNVVFWLATLSGVQQTAAELIAEAQRYGVTLPPEKLWALQWKGGMAAPYDESVLMPGQAW